MIDVSKLSRKVRVLLSAILAVVLIVGLVFAFGGVGWIKRMGYAGRDRDQWQQPDRVIEELDIAAGARIVDIGAGGGYFTFRLAQAVGGGGTVYAADVDEDMLEYIDKESSKRGLTQIETVRAAVDDARIPGGEIDLVFTSNTYHHLSDRVAYFAALQGDLAPSGSIAIIDYREGGHGTDPDIIKSEMTEAGYELLADHTFLDRQSFLIFRVGDG